MIAFSAYYSGFTGMGIVFIISIVAIFYWYKALEMFYGRNGREHEETGIRNTDDRLTSIERKISEISEKMK